VVHVTLNLLECVNHVMLEGGGFKVPMDGCIRPLENNTDMLEYFIAINLYNECSQTLQPMIDLLTGFYQLSPRLSFIHIDPCPSQNLISSVCMHDYYQLPPFIGDWEESCKS
jgi:hypothetical protein